MATLLDLSSGCRFPNLPKLMDPGAEKCASRLYLPKFQSTAYEVFNTNKLASVNLFLHDIIINSWQKVIKLNYNLASIRFLDLLIHLYLLSKEKLNNGSLTTFCVGYVKTTYLILGLFNTSSCSCFFIFFGFDTSVFLALFLVL